MQGRYGSVSFRNIVGSDPSAGVLREVVANAGSDAPTSALATESGGGLSEELSDDLVSAFLNHRILTHLIRHLTMVGLDLSAIRVAEAIWERCSTSTVVPALPSGPDGRIPLGQIGERLDHHRDIQRRVVATLAQSVPQSFLVMFGQGISLAHPEYAERFSHDIDLVVSSPESGHAVVRILNDLGFDTTDARVGSYLGVPFHDWTLDASNIDGHRMHVDISTGAITRSDGWMKPVVLPDLFDAAQAVDLPHLPAARVLVPCDTHQILLLAEKAQRTQRYDCRVRCDATVLTRLGDVDAGFVTEAARQSALSSSLRWALGGSRHELGTEHQDVKERVSSFLISMTARGTYDVSPLQSVASKAFRRFCASPSDNAGTALRSVR